MIERDGGGQSGRSTAVSGHEPRPVLARSAEGLYWMGRYLERAAHLCRLLRLQTQALVDRPEREIGAGWRRIYRTMNRVPPLGEIEATGDDFILADSFTLADDLTFERTNPGAVWSCFAMGRENARQMRHCISAEMWTRLNLAYLRIRKLGISDIWRRSPEDFYAQTAVEIDTFAGVAASTMYRGDGWAFLQLGRVIERAQSTTALLLFQRAADGGQVEDVEAEWTTVLRTYDAQEAYHRVYGMNVDRADAMTMLVTDPLLPNSLARSFGQAASYLASVGPGAGARAGGRAQRVAGRLHAMVLYEWPDTDDHDDFLRRMDAYCRELHELVTAAWFDYAVEDAPAS